MFKNPEELFGGIGTLLALIERIYASAEDPALWDGVLCEIARLLACESVVLFAGAPDARTQNLLAMVHMDPLAWQRYETYYAAINPIMRRCEQSLSAAEPWQSHVVLRDADLEKTEFYNDFFLPNQMHYSLGLRFHGGDVPVANLSCQRTRAGGPFEARESTILQTLRPHLLRALSLRRQLNAMGVQLQSFTAALEAYDQAVLGVGEDGTVLFSNPTADNLLAGRLGLFARKGHLRCEDREADLRLRAMITSVARDAAQSQTNSLALRDRDGAAVLHITVLPYAGEASWSGDLKALVFLSKPKAGVISRAAALTSAYGLTPLEARVADLLGAGMEITDIADHLKLAKESVRFYVKRVLAKTDTGRQAHLIALLAQFPKS